MKALNRAVASRQWFAATVFSRGKKPIYSKKKGQRLHTGNSSTILLKNVRYLEDDKLVSDHAWVPSFPQIAAFPIGSRIKFSAEAEAYLKGYGRPGESSFSFDYKLVKIEDISFAT